jgi:hypothetical protein
VYYQAINKGAEIMECCNSVVDLERVLGIHAFSMDRLLEKDPDFLVSNIAMLMLVPCLGINLFCWDDQVQSALLCAHLSWLGHVLQLFKRCVQVHLRGRM